MAFQPSTTLGNASDGGARFGQVTYTLHHCASADGDGYIWSVGKGSLTMTSLAGDQIEMQYDMWGQAFGMPTPTTAFGGFNWKIIGGSGKYADAKGFGTASLSVVYYYDAGGEGAMLTATWRGDITY